MARSTKNSRDDQPARPRSRLRQVGLGLGAFGVGAALWSVVTTLFARPAGGAQPPETAPKGPRGQLAPIMLAPDATPDLPSAPADDPEHVPTDLLGDADPTAAGVRAIDAFRPDPTAPVPDSMRESLRPATGPAPTLAANRGDFVSGLSQADAKGGA